MNSRTLHISVTATRKKSTLKLNDRNVEGIYAVKHIDRSLSDAVAANIAAESFHTSIPVEMPEDFRIQFFDMQTKTEIEPDYSSSVQPQACERVENGIGLFDE